MLEVGGGWKIEIEWLWTVEMQKIDDDGIT